MLEDAATAAISALMGEPVVGRGLVRAPVRDHVAGHAAGVMARIIADVVRILQAAREVRARLDDAARRGVRRRSAATSPRRSGGSSSPASSAPTGARRLPDVERYLRGADWRLERLHETRRSTATGCARSTSSRTPTGGVLEELPAGHVDGELGEVPWLLEELRISQFAQAIGPKGQAVEPKIRRILDEAR